eukprot:2577271-Rhodomonas_salina.1
MPSLVQGCFTGTSLTTTSPSTAHSPPGRCGPHSIGLAAGEVRLDRMLLSLSPRQERLKHTNTHAREV